MTKAYLKWKHVFEQRKTVKQVAAFNFALTLEKAKRRALNQAFDMLEQKESEQLIRLAYLLRSSANRQRFAAKLVLMKRFYSWRSIANELNGFIGDESVVLTYRSVAEQ